MVPHRGKWYPYRATAEAAIKDQDFHLIGDVYTEGAVILPPGANAITGIENIIQFWELACQSLGVKACRLKTVEMQVSGDTAYEQGRAQLEGTTGVMEAKYIVVWLQRNGEWRWHRDIWNMSE